MAEDPAVVRLEEQVKTLFRGFEELKDATKTSHGEMKNELYRLSGLIENGQLVRHQIRDAEKERRQLQEDRLQCRAQCDTRLSDLAVTVDELHDLSQNWRGRAFAFGLIIAAILAFLSSVGTALAIRLLDLTP